MVQDSVHPEYNFSSAAIGFKTAQKGIAKLAAS